MAKRMQEEKGDERSVAKSKPTLNLVSHAATSSSTVQSPTATKNLGTLRAPCQRVEFSSVAKRCRDGDKRTRRLVVAENDQKLLEFP